MPELPSDQYKELKARAPVRIALPRIDPKPYLNEDALEMGKGERRIRGGVVRPVSISPDKDGEWVVVGTGIRVWRVEVQSPGATGLRLHLKNVKLGPGSLLFIHAPGQIENFEFYSVGNLPKTREIYSASTMSDTVVIEIKSENNNDPTTDTFELIGVGHLYRGSNGPDEISAAGSCNQDVSCYPDWLHTADSVAKISYVSGNFIYFCSGALINNNSGDFSPLFLTAIHCGVDASNVKSLGLQWKYRSSVCNGPENYPPSSQGERVLATSASADSMLLEINGFLPENLTWAGWSIGAPTLGSAITGIHHPDASYQRISFGTVQPDDPAFPEHHQVQWSSGVTEPGSSGSPLFNQNHQILGQLHLGSSSCSNPTGTDYYGKFATAYPEFKNPEGLNYLEVGLGDDRFGDIGSADKAVVIQQGIVDNMVLRIGHDDWFRMSGQQYYDISLSWEKNGIRGELYRNTEPFPVATSQPSQSGSGAYITHQALGNGDTYYLRLFPSPGVVRQPYTLNFAIVRPIVPGVLAGPFAPINSLSDVHFTGRISANGNTGSYWFQYSSSADFSQSQSSTPTAFGPNEYHDVIPYTPTTLLEDTSYYFRLQASNGLDTATSNTISFHTLIGDLSTSPSDNLLFTSQLVTSTSQPLFITVTNSGQKDLTFSPVPVFQQKTPPFMNPTQTFPITSDCPAVIAPSASCHMAVRFHPELINNQYVNAVFSSSGGTRIIQFAGTGLGPAMAITFSEYLNFGDVLVGSTTSPRKFTIMNAGNIPMDLTQIYVSDGFRQTNDCPPFLDPQASCSFFVFAAPNHVGGQSGVLVVSQVGGNFYRDVYVTGFDVILSLSRSQRPSRSVPGASQIQTFDLALTPTAGMSGEARLTCTGALPGMTCEVSPALVQLGAGPATATVQVTTTPRSQRLRTTSTKTVMLKVNATFQGVTRSIDLPVSIAQ